MAADAAINPRTTAADTAPVTHAVATDLSATASTAARLNTMRPNHGEVRDAVGLPAWRADELPPAQESSSREQDSSNQRHPQANARPNCMSAPEEASAIWPVQALMGVHGNIVVRRFVGLLTLITDGCGRTASMGARPAARYPLNEGVSDYPRR